MSTPLPQTIGIDISKATLDAHACPAGIDRQFANTAKGHKPVLSFAGGGPDCLGSAVAHRTHRL